MHEQLQPAEGFLATLTGDEPDDLVDDEPEAAHADRPLTEEDYELMRVDEDPLSERYAQ